MISSFSQFLIEEEKTVYFTFGRMNPPTIGHGKVMDTLAAKAGKNPYRVYVSQTQDPKKNPLSYTDKIKAVRKMFPKHARSVMLNKNIKTAIDALVALYNEGFKRVVMVVGQDRITEFDVLLNNYNGKQARHGFYNFESIKVISAGARDPDAEGVEGMSASKMRQFASSNDFTSFSQGLPKSMNNKEARRLFNSVRTGMGLKEEKTFKNHIQLAPVSEIREAYVKDGLFEEGDEVVMLKHERVGKIKVLGANYVIVESKGETWRCWLNDVAKVDERTDQYGHMNVDYDEAPFGATPEKGPYHNLNEGTDKWYKDQPEWGTPESTKKAKKTTPGEQQEGLKGLWHNIRKRREKGLPRLKPGDKNYPKTLDIEEQSAMDRVKDTIHQDNIRIAKDKEALKLKHDRMMDRARRSRMLQLNKGVKK